MIFKVDFARLAEQDLVETVSWIRFQSGRERADRWKRGLVETIKTLRNMPLRCAVIDESHELGLVLRELHYFSHRIIFSVDETSACVHILRIYHSSRAPLRLDDLAGLPGIE